MWVSGDRRSQSGGVTVCVCVCVCVCVLVPQPVLGADAQLRPFGDHYFTLQLKVRDS